jgi:hypothetical protein
MTVAAGSLADDSRLPAASPSSGEPEESLSELARRAARLLRARLRRPRAVVSPGEATPPPLRVAVLHCLGPLMAVAMVTVVLAWSVWQVAVNYRLSVAGPASEAVRILEVSLEAARETVDLERQLERDVGRGAAAATDGRAARAESDGGGGQGLKIEGPLLGAVAAGAVLGVGGLAGLVVLRRYRARLEAEVPESAHDLVARSELLLDDIGLELGELAPEAAPATIAAPPATWEERSSALKAASDRLLHAQVATQDAPVFAASERVYERRRAPRIPVELEGELHWKGGRWPLLVNEISATGLRFLVEGQPVAPDSQQPLAATDAVSIVATALGQVISLNGKVAWRRAEEGATLAGLQFMTLTPEAEAVVAELCADASD